MKRFSWLTLFLAGGLATCLIYLIFVKPPASAALSAPYSNGYVSPPGVEIIFEEPPLDQLTIQYQEIDDALFKSLSLSGVDSSQITLRMESKPGGEVFYLKVNLAAEQNISSVIKNVDSALAKANATGLWTRQEDAHLCLSVYWNEKLTHVVNFFLPSKAAEPSHAAQPSLTQEPAKPQPKFEPPPSQASKPKLAIVVDDMGLQLAPLHKLVALNLPFTISILPFTARAGQTADIARNNNLEVMIHLPMEPLSSLFPGPDALYVHMSGSELTRLTNAALDKVPGARGVNNHMGSRFTADTQAMQYVLAAIKDRRLFFLDSLTTADSKAYSLASKMGMPAGVRNIFLDHDLSYEAVSVQVSKMFKMARGQGKVIVICHPHEVTLKALAEAAPRLKTEVEMVHLSVLIMNKE